MIGRIDIFICTTCRGHLVSRQSVDGATPFLMTCMIGYECMGSMRRSTLRVDQDIAPSFEWVKPSEADVSVMHPMAQEFFHDGGLLIRPLPEAAPAIHTLYDARRLAHEATLLLVDISNSETHLLPEHAERLRILSARWNARAATAHEEPVTKKPKSRMN